MGTNKLSRRKDVCVSIRFVWETKKEFFNTNNCVLFKLHLAQIFSFERCATSTLIALAERAVKKTHT